MRSIPLIDSRIVAQTFAMRRQIDPPKSLPPEPVMAQAQAYGSVLRDRSGQWRMWYLTDPVYCEYYAVSDDGLEWRKPELNLVSDEAREQGAGRNAFLCHHQKDAEGRWLVELRGPEGFSVLDAETSPHPAAKQRFTAIYLARFSGTDASIPGMCVAHSDDGVNWTAEDANPVIPGWRDTSSMLLYDQRIRKYVWYGRPTAMTSPATHANRLIARRESEDLIHWSPDRTVLDTDEADADAFDLLDETTLRAGKDVVTARERAEAWEGLLEGAAGDREQPAIRGRNRQWYGITVFPCADAYVGLGWMYDLPTGGMWVELLHSYDGLDWRREPVRQPFLPTPPGTCCCTMASPPVVVDDDIYIYYSYNDRSHHGVPAPDVKRGICVATLRRDRWVGYAAAEHPGEILTQVLSRPEIVTLNAAAEAGGQLTVEVLNADGEVLPGFSREECVPLAGDSLDLEPAWRSGKSLRHVTEGSVRLRILARRACVYGVGLG